MKAFGRYTRFVMPACRGWPINESVDLGYEATNLSTASFSCDKSNQRPLVEVMLETRRQTSNTRRRARGRGPDITTHEK